MGEDGVYSGGLLSTFWAKFLLPTSGSRRRLTHPFRRSEGTKISENSHLHWISFIRRWSFALIKKLSYTYIHTYIRTYIHKYIQTHTYIHTHTYIYKYTHTNSYIHTYIHSHIYIYFLKRLILQTVYTLCTRKNYKIVPLTNFTKYLHYGTSEAENYVYEYK